MATDDDIAIITDGPDCAGKTSMIRSLRSSVPAFRPYRYIHHGAYPGDTGETIAYFYALSFAARFEPQVPVVLDRSWLAEPAYGKAYRGGADRIGTAYRRMLERIALSVRGVAVIALPPWELVLDRWTARKGAEYLDTVEQLRVVYDAFAAMTPGIPTVRYDYTRDGCSKQACDAFAERVYAARPPVNDGPGAGWFGPGATLVIGDRYPEVNGGGDFQIGGRTFPFVSFSRHGCSAWLAEQLEDAGVPERNLYWVNAHRTDGTTTDPRFIERLEPGRIVALGARADDWCRRVVRLHDAEYDYVIHPSYHKRFHHHFTYPLKEVVT